MALDLSSSRISTCGSTNRFELDQVKMPTHFSVDLTSKHRKALRQTNNTEPRVRFAEAHEVFGEESKGRALWPSRFPAKQSWCVRRLVHDVTRPRGFAPEGCDTVPSSSDITSSSRDHSMEAENRCHGEVSLADDATGRLCGHDDLQARDRDVIYGDVTHLPNDPRDWCKYHVRTWLIHMRSHHALHDVTFERFNMNGKALCLMNVNMFCYRVPRGGAVLFRDFQRRLNRALSHSRHRS